MRLIEHFKSSKEKHDGMALSAIKELEGKVKNGI
jgi:hypothetical protein